MRRVVRSIPDRSGNNYTKTSSGGKARATGAVRYMDQHEETQLYTYERGRFHETDRDEAAARIEESKTKYQQHMAFTTLLPGEADIDQRSAAELIARSVQERRPDADIYAVAVHQQQGGNVHVHICFGTDTTLRRGVEGDLRHFQECAYELEQQLSMQLGIQPDAPEGGGRTLEIDDEDLKPRKLERQHQLDW